MSTDQTINSYKSLKDIPIIKFTYSNPTDHLPQFKIKHIEQCEMIFRLNWDLDTIQHEENLNVLFLNRNNQAIGLANIAKGINSLTVPPSKIMAYALITASAGIVIAHNHPAGNPQPSPDDITYTHRLMKLAELHGIALLDHMIITKDSFYSFKLNNMLDLNISNKKEPQLLPDLDKKRGS